MKTNDFLDRVCEVLNRPAGSLSPDDTPSSVPEWDSLGHLAILALIDEDLGVSIDDDRMRSFGSIRQLVELLRSRQALED